MSGCERGWPGYPHCVYPPPPQSHHHHHQPQWPHHHHYHHHHHHHPAVDYCGSVAQPPHQQQPHYVGYSDHAGGYMGGVFPSCPPHYWDGDDLVDAYGRVVKRRSSANRKERRRTQSINNAFAELRDCIPNVPADTKLSKIKTLRLATSYIAYLMGVLRADAHDTPAEAFKAELPPKVKTHIDHDKDESDMEAEESIFSPNCVPSESPLLPEVCSSVAATFTSSPSSSSSSPAVYYSSPSSLLSLPSTMDQSKPGSTTRTGWPESVWARELRF